MSIDGKRSEEEKFSNSPAERWVLSCVQFVGVSDLILEPCSVLLSIKAQDHSIVWGLLAML